MKCCDMNAGMLREPVEFRRQTRTDDGAGGFTEAWGAIAGAPTWANVKPMSGGEMWHSQRIEAKEGFRVVVRYWDGLLPSDVIRVRGRDHNILHIKNVEMRDEWLSITTSLGRAN